MLTLLACATPPPSGTHLDADTRVTTTHVGRDARAPSLLGDTVTEWWRVLDQGYEQGWDVAASPPGSGPLIVTVATSAPVTTTHDGLLLAGTWSVSDAFTVDARGRELPTRTEATVGGFRITVDDADAAYPITIDPIYTTAVWSVNGSTKPEGVGSSLGTGDFDADGYPDLAVGALYYKTTTTYEGAVRVYHGGASGPGSTPDTTLTGGSYEAYLGTDLAGADVDADGYDDLVVAAAYANTYGDDAGFVRLHTGSAAGLGTTAAWSWNNGTEDSWLGEDVGTGDVDGDGYADVVVGVPRANSDDGQFALFYGGSSGLASSPDLTVDGSGTYRLGSALAIAGDADGDGADELVAGDDRYIGTYDYQGRVFVWYGTSSRLSETEDTVLYGAGEDYRAGYRLADGGDINGDGYGDLLVDGLYYTTGTYNYGRFYVYEGSAVGWPSAADTTIAGSTNKTRLGFYGLAGGVDVDDDGYDDVAASEHVTNGFITYYGTSAGLTTSGATTVSMTSVSGISSLSGSLLGVPDIDGDGYDEFALGDYGYDGPTGTGHEYYGWAGLFEGRVDSDGDGSYAGGGGTDCDDSDAAVEPGATEIVGDGIDQDCDGADDCYVDADGDGYGTTSTVASTDSDCTDAGEAGNDDDCDDAHATASPAGSESTGDGVDGNCDGKETCFKDGDRDGYGSTSTVASTDTDCADAGEADDDDDCNDGIAAIKPSGTETPADGTDQDCDGGDTCYTDADADGYGATTTRAGTDLDCTDAGEANDDDDCDDGSSSIKPGAAETTADGVDQDCDGGDTCFRDSDADGYGATSTTSSSDLDCADASEANDDDDCDDSSAKVKPGATETPADGIDQDCDDTDDCYEDRDGDGYGSATVVSSEDMSCNDGGEADDDDDCADTDKSKNPGADEIVADGIDQDCDDADLCFEDLDGDGAGSPVEVEAHDRDCTDPGESATDDDCDDFDSTRFPANPEVAGNGIDDDCDGTDGCLEDLDGDGYGSEVPVLEGCGGSGTTTTGGDCDDADAEVNPGASEHCDDVDEDCDAQIDEDAVDEPTWYRDADDDGFGTEEDTVEACDDPGGYDRSDGDCDDDDDDVNPDAWEDCEADEDLNCDGLVGDEDEDCATGGQPEDDDTGSLLDGFDDEDDDDDDGGLCGCASGSRGGAWAMAAAAFALAARARPPAPVASPTASKRRPGTPSAAPSPS